MTDYNTVKIPAALAAEIDALIASGAYQARAEYVKELIRNDLRARAQEALA